MSSTEQSHFDRPPPLVRGHALPAYTADTATIDQVMQAVSRSTRRWMPLFYITLALAAAHVTTASGVLLGAAFGMIAASCTIPIALWCYRKWPHPPIIAGVCFTMFSMFALPILFSKEELTLYTPEEIISASAQVALYAITLTVINLMFHRGFKAPVTSYWGFAATEGKAQRLTINAAQFGLILCLVDFFTQGTPIARSFWRLLPQGATSIVTAGFLIITLMGSLILSRAMAAQQLTASRSHLFILTWTLLFIFNISSLLLSATMGMVGAVIIGVLLGSGRLPLRFIFIVFAILVFLNISKHEMRNRYWGTHAMARPSMPAFFLEWADLSLDKLFPGTMSQYEDSHVGQTTSSDSLIDRFDTMSILLFAQRSIEVAGVSPLGGESYFVIPELLIPRILWPDKPRTHEGQALLNIHFGRQTEQQTETAYIAWGLLAEAYGNFGPYYGPIILGAVIGLLLTLLENWSGPQRVMSLEGIVVCLIFAKLILSFEMSSGVLVTSMLQSIAILLLVTAPLVRRIRIAPRFAGL